MNKEMYVHVMKRFKLSEYQTHSILIFKSHRIKNINVRDLMIEGEFPLWNIRLADYYVFSNLPSKERAEEIVCYIKDVEVLFL